MQYIYIYIYHCIKVVIKIFGVYCNKSFCYTNLLFQILLQHLASTIDSNVIATISFVAINIFSCSDSVIGQDFAERWLETGGIETCLSLKWKASQVKTGAIHISSRKFLDVIKDGVLIAFHLRFWQKNYLQKGFVDLGIPILLREGNNSRLILVSPKDSPSYQSFINQYSGKLRGCLVLLFKQQFSMFKHYNTYFHNTF